MKKTISIFTLIVILSVLALGLFAPAGALASAADKNQVTESTGIRLYDKDGMLVNGTQLGQNDSVVSVKKAAQQYVVNGVAQENKFLVELEVRTTQDLIKLSSSSPDAAVTLILDLSSSMTECVNCGHKEDADCHEKRPDGSQMCSNYVSRLTETKTAAKEFLDSFAHLGMEGVDEDNKPRRMVSIISFENTATLRQDYIDVANASNLTTAKNVIDGLSVASGTNIEGALQLAHNVISNGMSNASEIKDVDYLYTILLTDGEPSMGMTNRSNRSSTTSITGDWNGSYSPNYADVDEVPAIAAAIRSFTLQSRLYSICLGVEIDHDSSDQDVNSTMALKPFSTWSDLGITSNTTVGDWLRSFSHAVYGDEESASADTILANFENVMAQIQIAARAWEVRDTMGEHMDFVDHVQVRNGNAAIFNVASESGDVVTWNLLQSDYNPQISEFITNADGTIDGTLGYTYRYIVELDNFHTGYNHGETQANASAVLDYAVEDEQDGTFDLYTNKEFTVPKVEGYTGELTFRKIDDNGDPVSGMNFTIKSDDAPTGWQLTAKSTEDGTVTFQGIPSGHEYRLDEQTTEGYKPIGDLPFTVEWAQTKIPANSELKNANGVYTLVNEIIPTDRNRIDFKVTKAFVDEQNNPLPATALADISKAYARFSLNYPNNTTERIELYNGLLVKEIEGLAAGAHTITEIDAPVEGYELISTRVTFSDSLDANAEHVISADGKTVSFTAERSRIGNIPSPIPMFTARRPAASR